jgi:hypothetical protein
VSTQPEKVVVAETEGGHWYDAHGNLVETVPSADGKKQVKCTLRHAKKHDLARGCTSIIGACDKPALTKWKMAQVALASCTLLRIEGETDESYQLRLIDEANTIGRKSAQEGNRIHAQIQRHYQLAEVEPDYREHVAGAVAELEDLGCDEWRVEVPCVSGYGYGTMADLVGYRSSRPVVLVDTKTKDGSLAELQAMSLYDEHYMQLAATLEALGLDPRSVYTAILLVSRTHPGSCVLVPVSLEQIKRGWSLFRALLAYTHEKDSHRPSWASRSFGHLETFCASHRNRYDTKE